VEDLSPTINSSADSNANVMTGEGVHQGGEEEKEREGAAAEVTSGTQLPARASNQTLLITPQSTASQPGDCKEYGSVESINGCFAFGYPQHPFRWSLGSQHD
jgi:hypothetical protein